MARKKGSGAPKPKVVNLELIEEGSGPYRVLKAIRKEFHKEMDAARVVLMWRKNMRADADGHMELGKCIRASEMQQELGIEYDFVITLNYEVWNDKTFTLEMQRALMDHEFTHIEKSLGKDGSQRKDTAGRLQWRIRHHDIEEFTSVADRHGMWKKDLERFGAALLKQQNPTLFEQKETGGEAVVH